MTGGWPGGVAVVLATAGCAASPSAPSSEAGAPEVASARYTVELTLVATADGGLDQAITSGWSATAMVGADAVPARFILLTGIDRLAPGRTGPAVLELERAAHLAEGATLELRDGARVVGRVRVLGPTR